MRCPNCRQPLVRTDRPPLRIWTCPVCDGCAATLAVLRRAIRHDVLQRAWNRTIGHARTSLLRCPSCSTAMNCVPTEGPQIDLCRGCHTTPAYEQLAAALDQLGRLREVTPAK